MKILNKYTIVAGILLFLYIGTYFVLRLDDQIIHGLHDQQHHVQYRNPKLSPFFNPLMILEEKVHGIVD